MKDNALSEPSTFKDVVVFKVLCASSLSGTGTAPNTRSSGASTGAALELLAAVLLTLLLELMLLALLETELTELWVLEEDELLEEELSGGVSSLLSLQPVIRNNEDARSPETIILKRIRILMKIWWHVVSRINVTIH